MTFQLMGYVPASHCFHVQTDDIDEQLKLVLDYFNINVTKDHVFSRCQVNSFCTGCPTAGHYKYMDLYSLFDLKLLI